MAQCSLGRAPLLFPEKLAAVGAGVAAGEAEDNKVGGPGGVDEAMLAAGGAGAVEAKLLLRVEFQTLKRLPKAPPVALSPP